MKGLLFRMAVLTLLVFGTVSCIPNTGKWVDLGLPSGTLWAQCNIGATTPEQFGNYYAWGETHAEAANDQSASMPCEAACDMQDIYCNDRDHGTAVSANVLQSFDDMTVAELGKDAHIPTAEQWQELLNNTQSEWTEYKGVFGRKFTGANGNSLFLPAAFYRYGSELYYAGTDGYYWSSSLSTDYPYGALGCYFYSDEQTDYCGYYRDDGFSVRAVRASQN